MELKLSLSFDEISDLLLKENRIPKGFKIKRAIRSSSAFLKIYFILEDDKDEN